MNETQKRFATSTAHAESWEPTTPEAASRPSQVREFKAFYDGTRFLLDNGRDFVPMDGRSIRSHIKLAGIADIDETVCRVQTEQFVKYNGPLAGKVRGVYESNGDLLLASTSPKIIPSKSGAFPTIEKFINDLLGGDDHAAAQVQAFLGWMKVARQAMLEGLRRPGQALVFAGPVACGKTLLIKHVIIPAMGGREGKPYKYGSSAESVGELWLG